MLNRPSLGRGRRRGFAFQGQHEFHHVVDAGSHTGRDRQIRAVLTALLNGLYQALTTRKRELYSNSR